MIPADYNERIATGGQSMGNRGRPTSCPTDDIERGRIGRAEITWQPFPCNGHARRAQLRITDLSKFGGPLSAAILEGAGAARYFDRCYVTGPRRCRKFGVHGALSSERT
jgi:hypothetical protein